jgi:hypothetical protein
MYGPEEFYETMRRFKRAEPFEPFEVVLNDGKVILINEPNVAFGPHGGMYLTGGADMEIHDFGREEVKEIRLARTKARPAVYIHAAPSWL